MAFDCYLFEAKSIQNWILDSGKLRDLVGASELIDALCASPLDDALDALGIASRVQFSRRAGGAFYAFSAQPGALPQLASLWPLVVQQYAPGLAFDHALAGGDDALTAFNAARDELRRDQARNRVRLPQAGPLVHRSQRTGQPAIQMRRTPDGDQEAIDAATHRQRRFSNLKRGSLADKLCPQQADISPTDWPLDLEPGELRGTGGDDKSAQAAPRAFPFIADRRSIAVMHADGNGLGQLLIKVNDHIAAAAPTRFIDAFRALSLGIEKATIAATRDAVTEVLIPARAPDTGLLPARPVVLGGDDLTMLLRADLALAFTERFLAAFEQHSATAMNALAEDFGIPGLPPRLTACAGIVYIKSSQPFHLAASLAEGITASVKQRAKASAGDAPAPSSLGFHRVTTAMIDDYGEIIEQQLSKTADGQRYCHSLGAYALSANTGLPQLRTLTALQALLEEPAMARGPARQVLSLLSHSHQQADIRYSRWLKLMADPQQGKQHLYRRYLQLMVKLAPHTEGGLPYRELSDAPEWRQTLANATRASPLGDLHALSAVGNRPAQAPITSQESSA